LGSLRWKPPLPIDSDTKSTQSATINASLPGPACIQGYPAWYFLREKGSGAAPPVSGSESCLIVDVVTPSDAFKDGKVMKKLPVIIKIHGGGYTLGRSDWMNANHLLPHSKGSVVFVAIQYRLGPLGFMGGEALRAQGGVANAGILDQRAAIEWVKRHVEKFGGDAQKMTIWGGSAGGGSVTAQMMMYGGVDDPPFRNVIGGEISFFEAESWQMD
jgi:carboxylesterase type B